MTPYAFHLRQKTGPAQTLLLFPALLGYTDGLDLALTLLGSMPPTISGLSPFQTLQTSSTEVLTPKGMFSLSSLTLTSDWTGPVDATLTENSDQTFTLTTPAGTVWADRSRADFFLPRILHYDQSTHQTFSQNPWWDSTAVSVLLGALDSRLPMPFATNSLSELPSRLWMTVLLASAGRTLKPWMDTQNRPARGYERRPFPAKAPKKRILEDLSIFVVASRNSTTANRCFLSLLASRQLLMPNAPYFATHWVKGPHWEAGLALAEPGLLALGRSLGPRYPDPLPFDAEVDILTQTLPNDWSAHAQLQGMLLLTQADHVLRDSPWSR